MSSSLYGCAANSLRASSLVASSLLERHVGSDDLAHLLLDDGEVFRRQAAREVEVVVEAVLDGRPDGELRLREQRKHGLRHDVRRRMSHPRQALIFRIHMLPRFLHHANEMPLAQGTRGSRGSTPVSPDDPYRDSFRPITGASGDAYSTAFDARLTGGCRGLPGKALSARGAPLCDRPAATLILVVAFCLWWAILDLNQ